MNSPFYSNRSCLVVFVNSFLFEQMCECVSEFFSLWADIWMCEWIILSSLSRCLDVWVNSFLLRQMFACVSEFFTLQANVWMCEWILYSSSKCVNMWVNSFNGTSTRKRKHKNSHTHSNFFKYFGMCPLRHTIANFLIILYRQQQETEWWRVL